MQSGLPKCSEALGKSKFILGDPRESAGNVREGGFGVEPTKLLANPLCVGDQSGVAPERNARRARSAEHDADHDVPRGVRRKDRGDVNCTQGISCFIGMTQPAETFWDGYGTFGPRQMHGSDRSGSAPAGGREVREKAGCGVRRDGDHS